MQENVSQEFKNRAKANPKRVVFPEGGNKSIIEAANILSRERLAFPVLIGCEEDIKTKALLNKVGNLVGIEIISPESSPEFEKYVRIYGQNRKVSEKAARHIVGKDIFFAGMMVLTGDADGMAAGIDYPTSLVLRAAGLTVGYEMSISSPSSFFIMVLPEIDDRDEPVLVFADAAVNISPTARQLAEIAVLSGKKAKKLLGLEPKVAFLSFSTKGSASHGDVDKVVEAVGYARKMAPEMAIDGEFQADAALIKRVARKKTKAGTGVAGKANVLIFPDLDAGNIAYKITQYLAGAKAYGPFLQGFAKPVNDLSRGALIEDIVAVTAVTVIEAQEV